MALVDLFTYDWPAWGVRAAVALDDSSGQAYNVIYEPFIRGGYQSETLHSASLISYDEVRRKARCAREREQAENSAFLTDPAAYDGLNEQTWRRYVRDPPHRILRRSQEST